MNPTEYVNNAVLTKSDKFYEPNTTPPKGVVKATNLNVDVLHAIVGISTEAGELLDVVKKNLFYGKPVDYVNLDEEMGDVLWYVAIYASARGLPIERMMQTNIEKLRVRFPSRFTEHDANNRDLAAERATLEAGSK